MSEYTAIDLSQLPAPEVIEQLDYESIFNTMLDQLKSYGFTALVESDPAYKILEISAYRELLIRQQFNERAQSLLLAYAQGADLDHIGANYGVKRKMIKPAEIKDNRPIPAVMENDDEFRRRIQLGPEGYSTAGPEGAYLFHASKAHDQILDVKPYSLKPGEVTVCYLPRSEVNITLDQEIKQALEATLNREDIRPLTDKIIIRKAEIIPYHIEAEVHVFHGPSKDAIQYEVEKQLNVYLAQCFALGKTVALSGIYDALHTGGVQRVALKSPATDITTEKWQAPKHTTITLNFTA
ncbi:baseplate assembly protein [Zooshikella ganghwensis]|uniref:Baseplate assembly protein n=2 Tax=Zooshikella ganghwensis TaxID=202772 RepID=A0A4P9VH30_9GAMM|nr:baseplate J/gp47 family protein [Zooshikella ganghwensis]RDH41662.1 baseplate assembly protein [Zooshikella ganghwensis]RDH41684.1 baseplate assembly protein [Zooshikella ganghwensis]RDH41741.1 baseplate assembly protein [Zooshikella ganghwensis]